MPRNLFLDVHCDPCHRLACRQCVEELRAEGHLQAALAALAAGDPERLRRSPRRERFEREPDGGQVYVRPFKGKGSQHGTPPPALSDHQGRYRANPHGHRRPDGGWTWDLSCPHGHTKPVRNERIRAEFEAFPPGQETRRIAL
jgi:hypothetical protein